MNSVVKTILGVVRRTMMQDHQSSAMQMSGSNPFETMLAFCHRFRPEAIPADLGGEPVCDATAEPSLLRFLTLVRLF